MILLSCPPCRLCWSLCYPECVCCWTHHHWGDIPVHCWARKAMKVFVISAWKSASFCARERFRVNLIAPLGGTPMGFVLPGAAMVLMILVLMSASLWGRYTFPRSPVQHRPLAHRIRWDLPGVVSALTVVCIPHLLSTPYATPSFYGRLSAHA